MLSNVLLNTLPDPLPNINKMVQNSDRLNNVIAQVVELITRLLNAEKAAVMLYAEETNELILQKPAFNMTNDEIINIYRVPISNGYNSANVYLTGEPFITNDPQRDNRVRQQFVKLIGVRNFITIPLKIDNRSIGILHVTNKKGGKFTHEDIEISTFLASHLAIFIENAIIYERERKQAEELDALNNTLQIQHSRLEKLFAVHNNLIQQVLNENGMYPMIKTLADLLDARVFVEDKHFNLLVNSHPEEKDISTLELLRDQGMIPKVNSGYSFKSAPYQYGSQQMIRFTSPIGGAKCIMGYLSMVIEAEKIPNDIKMLAFEQGAMALGLEMMKGRIKFEVESRFSSDFLDDLFSGKKEYLENIMKRAEFFNYDLKKSSRVVVINLDEAETAENKLQENRNYTIYQGFHHQMISAAKKIFPGSLAVSKRNCVELLLPVVPSLTQEVLEHKLVEVQDKTAVYTKDKRVLIGVGSECLQLEDYRRSYQQAHKALIISQFFIKQNGIVFYDQLGIYSLLLEINDLTLLQKLVTNKLGPLLKYDRKKNSSVLVDTLETYLRTGGSLKETAPELFIHVASLKYRLTRIEDLLNIDLRKTESLFDLQLALFAHRFMEKNRTN